MSQAPSNVSLSLSGLEQSHEFAAVTLTHTQTHTCSDRVSRHAARGSFRVKEESEAGDQTLGFPEQDTSDDARAAKRKCRHASHDS